MSSKKAVVVHSGGMDSSLCLAIAIERWGRDQVVSLSFNYDQRHQIELVQARKICADWNVDHVEYDLPCLPAMTDNALTRHDQVIIHEKGQAPNTLVVGRNGLMAQLAGIYAYSIGAQCIYLGVIEVEAANSGYRDCKREYIDLIETILRIDLDAPQFSIETPVIRMTKAETMICADQLGVLPYLLENTITCYEGIPYYGCKTCPACRLRNEGITEFLKTHSDFEMPY